MASEKDPSDNNKTDEVIVIDINKEEQKAEPPKKYAVFVYNDDFTPRNFVLWCLNIIFGIEELEANTIVQKVEETNKPQPVRVYPKDIAETKAAQAKKFAQEAEVPLLFEAHPVEND